MSPAELIAAAMADPSVLWAIRTAEVLLAGPWKRGDTVSRREPLSEEDGMYAARVSHRVVTRGHRWCEDGCARPGSGNFCMQCGTPLLYEPAARAWKVDVHYSATRNMPRNYSGVVLPSFDSREEAEAWCDAALHAAGWLLVPEVLP
ncbi:MAG: hypothetical protein FJ090_19880 [Deltaproteobacteria bacterium]|nr:hypothetical protein [Deltaproteobacteria bacterium]